MLLHAEWMLKSLCNLLPNLGHPLRNRLSCSFGSYMLKTPINLLNINLDTEV